MTKQILENYLTWEMFDHKGRKVSLEERKMLTKIEQQKDGDFKITYTNGSIDFIYKKFILYFEKKYKIKAVFCYA